MNSDLVVEYPIRLFIERTLTGKLAEDGHNFIYCIQFEEKVKKPLKKLIPGNVHISSVFRRFLRMGNSDL